MSTQFQTKKEALNYGLYLIGRNDLYDKELSSTQDNMYQVGNKHEEKTDIYSLENSKGNKIELGIEPFRSGFCLWLINPDNGFASRV